MPKLTEAGRRLIKHFEASDNLHLKPYRDSAGVLTIGWGHTKTTKRGMRITAQEAENLLADDLKDATGAVDAALKAAGVSVNDARYSAMVSAVFNLGPNVIDYGESTWWRQYVDLVRSNDSPTSEQIGEAIAPLVRWNKVKVKGGWRPGRQRRWTYKPSKGLTRRRFSEIHLFLTGAFSPQFEAVGMSDPNTDKKTAEREDRGGTDQVRSPKERTSELYLGAVTALFIALNNYLGLDLTDAQVGALATIAVSYGAYRTYKKAKQ